MKRLICLLSLVLIVSGCATNPPKYRQFQAGDSEQGLIVVEHFDMTHADNSYTGESDFSKIIAEHLAGALQERKLKATVLEKQGTQISGEYRITGEITKINPGSLSGRFWVGPGVGMARISAKAVLIRVSDNKELTSTKVTLSSSAYQGTESILRYISGNVARKIADNFYYALKNDAK
jgi:hypothetical protein